MTTNLEGIPTFDCYGEHINVPFHINYILYGSSDFSYKLNCKIVSYVHSYIIAYKRFWFFFPNGLDHDTNILCLSVGMNEWGNGFINVGMNVFMYMLNNKLIYHHMTKVKLIIYYPIILCLVHKYINNVSLCKLVNYTIYYILYSMIIL